MPPRRTSQTHAMNLRHHLYCAEPGATYNTYPGSLGKPVPVAYTRAELDANREDRDRALIEWAEADPEGFGLWSAAQAAVTEGDDGPLTSGWSAMIRDEHGLRIADPCAYCRECRTR